MQNKWLKKYKISFPLHFRFEMKKIISLYNCKKNNKKSKQNYKRFTGLAINENVNIKMSLQTKAIKFDEKKQKIKFRCYFRKARKCSQKWVPCMIHRK